MTKQQEHLKRLQVEPIYYREHDVITVCLLRHGGEILARGIAVCSPLDQFVKKTGRDKALGMALRATKRGEDSEPIFASRFHCAAPPPVHPLYKAEEFEWRSAYMPILTGLEKQLLSKILSREAETCLRNDGGTK